MQPTEPRFYMYHEERFEHMLVPPKSSPGVDPTVGSSLWLRVAEFEEYLFQRDRDVSMVSTVFPWYTLRHPTFSRPWCSERSVKYLGQTKVRPDIPMQYAQHRPCPGTLWVGTSVMSTLSTACGNVKYRWRKILAIIPAAGVYIEDVWGLTYVEDAWNYNFVLYDKNEE